MKFVKIILIVAVALTMALGGIYLMSEKKETTEIKACPISFGGPLFLLQHYADEL